MFIITLGLCPTRVAILRGGLGSNAKPFLNLVVHGKCSSSLKRYRNAVANWCLFNDTRVLLAPNL